MMFHGLGGSHKDLVPLAESVHQATMGNSERAAATMDAYAKSTFPPQPYVVRSIPFGAV